MLRVVLLLLYLYTSYSLGQAKTGTGYSDPSGLHQPPPPTTDSGAGNDPDG